MTGLAPADDDFHPVARPDDSWTETCWFAGMVPERGLGVWTYPVFRPHLGIMSCGIYVWEHGTEEIWQLPYYRVFWHMRYPAEQRLTSLRLDNGLEYDTLEPLTRYRVAYADGDAISFELEFEALHEPSAHGLRDGRGHFDQLGRVTGELTLYGEKIEIDCIEMRDRTWGPRREGRQATMLGYDYAASSKTSGFHSTTLRDGEAKAFSHLFGFVLREHGKRELVEATREVERDPHGRPERIVIRAIDEDGQPYDVHGVVASRFGMPSTPWFNWVSQVHWTLPDGTVAVGEDQETWSPALFRALRRGEL
jgi:hypothetical protein